MEKWLSLVDSSTLLRCTSRKRRKGSNPFFSAKLMNIGDIIMDIKVKIKTLQKNKCKELKKLALAMKDVKNWKKI